MSSDTQNLESITDAASVDETNASFYGRFPYPWRPMTFSFLADPQIPRGMLNQDIGDYSWKSVGPDAKVWVAGCGTNQAIYTALNLQDCEIVGSDLSQQSLDLCAQTASHLKLKNIRLVCESINAAPYDGAFDYIVCTGVVHHNAIPGLALSKLAAALKPGGIIELMVYNRYHRAWTTAFQKAIRALGGTDMKLDEQLALVRELVESAPAGSPLAPWLRGFISAPESKLADALMQPVEHSYTVQSLSELANSCGLQIVMPLISAFDKEDGRITWNARFPSQSLQDRYDQLPDIRRWQITNLLLQDNSPMLWFYLQRSGEPRLSERAICDAFLETRFKRCATTRHTHVLGNGDVYSLSKRTLPYPPAHEAAGLERIIAQADGNTSMRTILLREKMNLSFSTVNDVRLRTATSAFPYLRAVV